MKSKILFFFCLFLLFGCKANNTNDSEIDYSEYESSVMNFEKVSEVDYLTIKEGSFILFSRKTCPFCRDFVPQLLEAISKIDKPLKIYYVDTEAFSSLEKKKEVIETFGIKTVPSFIFFERKGEYIFFDRENDDLEKWVEEKLE